MHRHSRQACKERVSTMIEVSKSPAIMGSGGIRSDKQTGVLLTPEEEERHHQQSDTQQEEPASRGRVRKSSCGNHPAIPWRFGTINRVSDDYSRRRTGDGSHSGDISLRRRKVSHAHSHAFDKHRVLIKRHQHSFVGDKQVFEIPHVRQLKVALVSIFPKGGIFGQ